MSRRVRLAGACLAILVGFSAAARGETFTVRALLNNTFVPSNLTIQVGDSVRFVNEGSGFHNVIEDGGAFHCAEGCDEDGGDGDPSSSDWSFTLTFPTAGTVGYYCDVHGSPGVGMIGRIHVVVAGSPGRLDFSAETYSTGEAGGGASILVRRAEGATGAVTVRYAATAGTASAADFTPVSGTLSWGDGDLAAKSFTVPVADDEQAEGNETVLLSLSQPSGGATLGRKGAVLTLVDDDTTSSPGRLRFRSDAFAGAEGSAVEIAVVREAGSEGAVSVAYTTSDGTATAGSDYSASAGTLSFAGGEAGEKTVSIPLARDADGAAERFSIALANPTGGADLAYPSRASVVILPERTSAGALSEGAVACDAARLAGLLARGRVEAPAAARTSFLVASFTATGDFAGLATIGISGGGEAALAFSTNPEETTLLANPARPQLFSVSLARNELNSDLVPAGSADRLTLAFNPTLDADPPAGNLLLIDNVAGEAGRPADAKPGRGLAPLLSACHGDFGGSDVHLFRVLAKVARGEAPGASGFELAIYRAPATGRYRLDLFPLDAVGAPSGRLSAELAVVRSPAGDLTAGTLHRLGPCAAGQTAGCSDLSGLAAGAALALFKPVLAGPPPPTPYRLRASGPAEAAVDFSDLLAETTWRRPPD